MTYTNPSQCYSGIFFGSDCDQYDMYSSNYGNYQNSQCDYINQTESSLAISNMQITQLRNEISGWIAAISQCNANVSQYSTLADAANSTINKRNVLIRKLYKACSSKCKKIR